MKIFGRHYRSQRAVEVEIVGELISQVRELPDAPPGEQGLPWIAPGFVDLQINGYLGHEFGSPLLTVDHVVKIVEQLPRFGVTRFCPTVTTASRKILCHALSTLARACAESAEVAHYVAGIHLEGPYISAEDGPRGAHPTQHCRRPDVLEFDQLQAAAAGLIRLVTLSAEFSESPSFIARLTKAGVSVALGHMSASSAQIRAAVDAGATLSTHLGNGAHRTLPRHPNYIWDQLADDRLTATLIADGHHLPAEVVQTFVRAKSAARVILVSDLSGMAGLPPGEYSTDFCRLEILADERLVVAGQRELLAGAARPIGTGISNVMRFAGVDLATAVGMASSGPLRAIGHTAVDVRSGDPADLVSFSIDRDDLGLPCQLRILQTIARGRVVF